MLGKKKQEKSINKSSGWTRHREHTNHLTTQEKLLTRKRQTKYLWREVKQNCSRRKIYTIGNTIASLSYIDLGWRIPRNEMQNVGGYKDLSKQTTKISQGCMPGYASCLPPTGVTGSRWLLRHHQPLTSCRHRKLERFHQTIYRNERLPWPHAQNFCFSCTHVSLHGLLHV